MPTAFENLPQSKINAITLAGVEEFASRTYSDASTDRITEGCGISKGLLYHYFGTKQKFYLYCLQYALDTLVKTDLPIPEGSFYTVLFAGMELKMQQCAERPLEVKLLNMASREFSREVKAEKDALFGRYAAQMRASSEQIMHAAVTTLQLKDGDAQLAVKGLMLYSNALVSHYLMLYQNTPEAFFAQKEAIIAEAKSYVDLMLLGICTDTK